MLDSYFNFTKKSNLVGNLQCDFLKLVVAYFFWSTLYIRFPGFHLAPFTTLGQQTRWAYSTAHFSNPQICDYGGCSPASNYASFVDRHVEANDVALHSIRVAAHIIQGRAAFAFLPDFKIAHCSIDVACRLIIFRLLPLMYEFGLLTS